jgi:general transcription factor 3C polypeptide 3 (transcription factor C subunit 4)
MLRQIKAMDYGLVNDDARRKFFSEKGSYSAQDESGRLIVNKDMDIALLMVYGHILYTGTSYAYALSKFTATGLRNSIRANEARLFLQSLRLGP